MHIQEPFIETLYTQPKLFIAGASYDALGYRLEPLLRRSKAAKRIIDYTGDGDDLWPIYDSLADIMVDYPRISLYIPFKILEQAPEFFRDAYLCAWRECWAYHDCREQFNLGDIYEEEASKGEPERVVKAMHLVPFLIKYGYLTVKDAQDIMASMRNDNLLRWSLMDAAEAMRSRNIIKPEDYKVFTYFKLKPRQKGPTLLYQTDARKQWLDEMAKNYGVGEGFKLKNPTGPFVKNIDAAAILKGYNVDPQKFYLIGGSRLKGYGRDASDVDVFEYDPHTDTLRSLDEGHNRPVVSANQILDTVWVGPDVMSTVKEQFRAAERCFGTDETRLESLRSMEVDLLQFRLMHKGIPCAYPELFQNPKKKAPIDDNSAFYTDEYRTIAMKLFAKYIILPEK